MFFWTEEKEEIYILKELVIIIKQYFPELINKFEGLTDVRNQSYVKYQMKVIFIVRLMGLMCEMKSMQGMTRELNNTRYTRRWIQKTNWKINIRKKIWWNSSISWISKIWSTEVKKRQ